MKALNLTAIWLLGSAYFDYFFKQVYFSDFVYKLMDANLETEIKILFERYAYTFQYYFTYYLFVTESFK